MITCGAETVFIAYFALETPPHNYGETLKGLTEPNRKFRLVMLDNSVYLCSTVDGTSEPVAAMQQCTATQAMDDSMEKRSDLSAAI